MSLRNVAVIVFILVVGIQVFLYLTNTQPADVGSWNENFYKWDREQRKQLIAIGISIVVGAIVIFALPSKGKKT
jgi:formate hydrogenlyase subunit 3/multisubunit Na+/H+ antiporter MnhD subunit